MKEQLEQKNARLTQEVKSLEGAVKQKNKLEQKYAYLSQEMEKFLASGSNGWARLITVIRLMKRGW